MKTKLWREIQARQTSDQDFWYEICNLSVWECIEWKLKRTRSKWLSEDRRLRRLSVVLVNDENRSKNRQYGGRHDGILSESAKTMRVIVLFLSFCKKSCEYCLSEKDKSEWNVRKLNKQLNEKTVYVCLFSFFFCFSTKEKDCKERQMLRLVERREKCAHEKQMLWLVENEKEMRTQEQSNRK